MSPTSNRPPDYLTLPLLQSEVDPTATDFRQLLRWSIAIPRTVLVSNGARTVVIGSIPPANIEPLQTVGTYVGTPASGLLTIPITGYSYGYTPIVTPGDSSGSLGTTVPIAASSSKTSLVVACYTPSGAVVTTAVRVNYILMGA